MNIEKNLALIKQEIANFNTANNLTNEVTILAATKYVSDIEIKTLVDLGVNNIGENRVQDFLKKYTVLQQDKRIIWHFIGSLQTNKVNKIIDKIDYLHSLDREKLAIEINKHANKIINCFVEVNLSGETSKHGLEKNAVLTFIKELEKYDKIRVVGLMTMASNTNDEIIIRQTFSSLKQLQQEVINLKLDYAPCTELSMGMSNDYLYAILEGATFIRIGSRLFSK